MIEIYIGLHVKYLLFLSCINATLIFSKDFWKKNILISNLWKSVQWVPSCSIRIDGETDMMKLIFAFRNFANAPKNRWHIPSSVEIWEN